MVAGRPGKPVEPGPNPHSCDIGCSQSREWGHQGWLGHFQEGQKGHYQVQRAQEGHFHNFSVVDLYLLKYINGLTVIGLQSFHSISAQQFEDLWWQIDRPSYLLKDFWGPDC